MTAIRKAEEGETKSQAVEQYANEYFKNMNFDFPKPVETTNFTTNQDNSEKTELKEDNSKLTLQE